MNHLTSLSDYFDVTWLGKHPWKKWLEVIITAEGTSVRCRICNKYFDELGFPYQEKPGLAKPEGILLKMNKNKTEDSKRKIYELLKEHEEGKIGKKGLQPAGTTGLRTGRSIHSKILSALRQRMQPTITTSAEALQSVLTKKEDNPKCEITGRMLRTVYSEVKMNIPFKLHPKVVLLMRLNSAEMGNHHRDNNAAKRMLQSISKHMHMLLLTHLTSDESGQISFLLDTTTDLRGNHYLITYIRALEEDKDPENGNLLLVRPVVYFYKLLLLAQSEDANAMLTKIVEQVTKDCEQVSQFQTAFKQKLLGFGSDGASVMQGKNNGLAKNYRITLETRFIRFTAWLIDCN